MEGSMGNHPSECAIFSWPSPGVASSTSTSNSSHNWSLEPVLKQNELLIKELRINAVSVYVFEYIWYVLKCSYLKVIPNNSNKWIIVGKKWWTAVELYIFLVWLPITTWHTWLLKSGLHYFTFWASSETGHRLTTANVSVSACSHTQCASQTK